MPAQRDRLCLMCSAWRGQPPGGANMTAVAATLDCWSSPLRRQSWHVPKHVVPKHVVQLVSVVKIEYTVDSMMPCNPPSNGVLLRYTTDGWCSFRSEQA